MSGYKSVRAMIMLSESGRPIGFKINSTGEEWFFPIFDAAGNLVRADDTTMATPTLSQVAVTGDYQDLSNRPTIPVLPPVPSTTSVTRALNTIFRPSTTRNVMGSYSVQITVTASIANGQDGDVILETASNAAFTADVLTVAIAGSSQVFSLAVALQGIQKAALQLIGMIPAGYYARLRTVNNTGTPVYAFRAGQETLM